MATGTMLSVCTYAVSVTAKVEGEGGQLFSKVTSLSLSQTFNHLFQQLANENDYEPLSVFVAVGPQGSWKTVELSELVQQCYMTFL